MHDVLRFWLDRGVDGFRADVIHLIGKDPTSPEHPEIGTLRRLLETDRRSQRLIRGIRALLDSYPGQRMMVGEVYILDTARVATFTAPNLLHLAFHFPPLWSPWSAEAWQYQFDATYREVGAVGGWPTWVLSNHDCPRHRSRYGSEARARAAAVLLLTQRGTPFLYAGEELGLQNAVIPPERAVDPAGRDVCRAPIPWDPTPAHGWSTNDPWLPWPPEPEHYNVATLREDQTSIIHLYRRLLRARRESEALRLGEWKWLPSVEGALAYVRQFGGDRRAVIVNFTDEEVRVPLDGPWQVDIASDGVGEGKPYSGVVAPSAALLMK